MFEKLFFSQNNDVRRNMYEKCSIPYIIATNTIILKYTISIMKKTSKVTLFDFNTVTRDKDVIEQLKLLKEQRRRREEEKLLKEQEDREKEEEREEEMSEFNETENETEADVLIEGGPVAEMLEQAVVISGDETVAKRKRSYTKRPDNWKDIAQHYISCQNFKSTVRKYELHLMHSLDDDYWYTMLNRWKRDMKKKKAPSLGRKPKYGESIDNDLAGVVQRYFDAGVPMSNYILKLSIINLLQKNGRQDLVDDPAFTFGVGFAHRFYKRHKFVTRVVTTKIGSCD